MTETQNKPRRRSGISKGSVANYLSTAEAAGLTHQAAAALDDAALMVRVASGTTTVNGAQLSGQPRQRRH